VAPQLADFHCRYCWLIQVCHPARLNHSARSRANLWAVTLLTLLPSPSICRTSEVLCENNIAILRLLSEEVFDFSKETMTAAKAEALRQSLAAEFRQIFELFDFILGASSKPSLICRTLQTLQRYVTWIPDQYLFETRLLETLCVKFFPVAAFRTDTLMVLAEVGGLDKPTYNHIFEQLYVGVLSQLVRFLPPDTSLRRVWGELPATEQTFVRHLALFLTGYFTVHAGLLEVETYRPALLSGLNYLVAISDVDDSEVFKICLDYWLHLSNDLYTLDCSFLASQSVATGVVPMGGASRVVMHPRKALYAEVLSRVREVMINHMAKPEEVLIEVDESGEVVRETTKDTDAIALYKVMRDTLVYLTHLDPEDTGVSEPCWSTRTIPRTYIPCNPGCARTESIMLDKLRKQVDNPKWTWDALNTLCYSIGSVSGTWSEAEEKRFLVLVIKDLLGMCEAVLGKNNKAVVASNIMYIVGQYPRFLRAHWKFLRTVV
jgi:exportin-1